MKAYQMRLEVKEDSATVYCKMVVRVSFTNRHSAIKFMREHAPKIRTASLGPLEFRGTIE